MLVARAKMEQSPDFARQRVRGRVPRNPLRYPLAHQCRNRAWVRHFRAQFSHSKKEWPIGLVICPQSKNTDCQKKPTADVHPPQSNCNGELRQVGQKPADHTRGDPPRLSAAKRTPPTECSFRRTSSPRHRAILDASRAVVATGRMYGGASHDVAALFRGLD